MLDPSGQAVEVAARPYEGDEGLRFLFRAGDGRQGQALQLFGQIGVGEFARRAVQGREEAEAAGEGDEFQPPETDGAAAGAADEGGDFPQRAVGRGFLDGLQQFFPGAGVGEAAEVAGDGVGLAVFGGQAAPGVRGAGQVEYGVQAGAEVTDLAAGGGGGEDVGEDGEELGVGKGGGAHGVELGIVFLKRQIIPMRGECLFELCATHPTVRGKWHRLFVVAQV